MGKNMPDINLMSIEMIVNKKELRFEVSQIGLITDRRCKAGVGPRFKSLRQSYLTMVFLDLTVE